MSRFPRVPQHLQELVLVQLGPLGLGRLKCKPFVSRVAGESDETRPVLTQRLRRFLKRGSGLDGQVDGRDGLEYGPHLVLEIELIKASCRVGVKCEDLRVLAHDRIELILVLHAQTVRPEPQIAFEPIVAARAPD